MVKRGDTLWAISGVYLLRPWRWPELWGMNLQQIRNPHLIYPGQKLYLEKKDGYARLRTELGDEELRRTVDTLQHMRDILKDERERGA